MEAMLYVRQDEGAWSSRSLFDTVLRPLVNAEPPAAFVF